MATNSLSRIKTAMATALAASAGMGAAADTLAINFLGTGYAPTGASVTATAFGIAPGDWANIDAANASGSTTVSGVSVAWTIVNDWNQFAAATPGDGEVFFGYLDDTGGGATVDLSGLAAWLAGTGDTAYTVQVLQGSDNATSFSDTQVFDGPGGSLLTTLTNGTSGGGGALGGATNTSGGLTSDTLSLQTEDRNNTVRGTISGIIITSVPEPGSLALLGLGGLAILRRRR